MTVRTTRKGDMIEFNGGEFRLERVVLTAEGEARRDDGEGVFKLYRKVETAEGTDADGNPTRVTPDGEGVDQPTTYLYRYEPAGEFTAADDDAAITEAKRLISGS